jgi:hypothetical protein
MMKVRFNKTQVILSWDKNGSQGEIRGGYDELLIELYKGESHGLASYELILDSRTAIITGSAVTSAIHELDKEKTK